MAAVRKIIHIDMDAFFASVEQRDHPEYRGKPVIVGGDPDKRGVVATASYEARKYGVHSAMPSRTALQLCPNGIFVHPRFEAYREISEHIREIFEDYTALVEPLSLDEAYLDVTINKKNMRSATRIAQQIQRRILEETGLTASAGVSNCKFVAKIASDYRKPKGLTVIPPPEVERFVLSLSVGKFFGVGKVTERKMNFLGIQNGWDLRKWDLAALMRVFGKAGLIYYKIVRGIDDRPVVSNRKRKSVGVERTFAVDVSDIDEMRDFLQKLAVRVSYILQQKDLKCRTITLKVRYSDFETITRARSFSEPLDAGQDLFRVACVLLAGTKAGERLVRLLGLSVSKLIYKDELEDPEEPYLPFIWDE